MMAKLSSKSNFRKQTLGVMAFKRIGLDWLTWGDVVEIALEVQGNERMLSDVVRAHAKHRRAMGA